jgi:hypothetical protein
MAFVDIELTGGDDIMRRLGILEKQSKAVALAAVSAGLGVLASAAKQASHGTIRREVGKYIRSSGDVVTGRAGLMQFPRKGDGQTGPHGVYLDQGTRYIAARGFIGNALRGASGKAKAAMKRAAERKIAKLATSK